jgi:hypothetical protein
VLTVLTVLIILTIPTILTILIVLIIIGLSTNNSELRAQLEQQTASPRSGGLSQEAVERALEESAALKLQNQYLKQQMVELELVRDQMANGGPGSLEVGGVHIPLPKSFSQMDVLDAEEAVRVEGLIIVRRRYRASFI